MYLGTIIQIYKACPVDTPCSSKSTAQLVFFEIIIFFPSSLSTLATSPPMPTSTLYSVPSHRVFGPTGPSGRALDVGSVAMECSLPEFTEAFVPVGVLRDVGPP